MTTTGYCACGKCCGWTRSRLGQPIFSSGPNKGKPKKIGVTASGSRARKGTVAADSHVLPFGTIVFVPGYGYGRVEDRGFGVRGDHIDLFFGSHTAALHWGRQKKTVKIWLPPKK